MAKAKLKALNESFLIPIYIGVTGHRDVRDEYKTEIKELIKAFIKNKQKLCPDTPIVLLTPLAEGADRIATIAAIECKIDYIALLPMPQEQYKHTFDSAKSVNEFDKLISKASKIIALPLQNGIRDEDLQHAENRENQYYENGLFLARQCHFLIALWDGIDNNKRGGTSEVVKFKRLGIPGKYEDNSNKLHHLQTGPIYHILTPRKSTPVPSNPLTTKIYYANYYSSDVAKAEKDEFEFHLRINSFNKDSVKLFGKIKKKVEISVKSMLPAEGDLNNNLVLFNLAYKHSIAGALSTHFQNKRFRALKILLSLVVLAFLFLYVNGEFIHSPLLLILYPVTLGIGTLWYFLSVKKGYEYKHEDYRALSEAYRVQFYLSALGKPTCINEHFLKRHRGNLEWLRYALRSFEMSEAFHTRHNAGLKDNKHTWRINFLKTNWIHNQLEYFKRTTAKHTILTRNYKLYTNFFFINAILAACLLFTISLKIEFFLDHNSIIKEILSPFLTCCTSVFLVIAAAFHGYADKMIFAEQANNYEQMTQLYILATEKLNIALEKQDEDEAINILTELAYEALNENSDWLLLHRSRPIEMPI